MKLCANCYRVTAGKPIFCNFCGSSYSIKLCPRQHVNPRSAEACSQCGSRDMSQPQPKIPLWLRPLFLLLTVSPGFVLLAALVVFVAAFLRQLLSDPNGLAPLMCIGLYLCIAFFIWMMLPNFLKRLLKRLFLPSKGRDGKKH